MTARYSQHRSQLEARGIHFPAGAEYVQPEWKSNFNLAMDAAPALNTTVNGGIPAWLSNLVDPQAIRILLQPTRAAEIYGETKKGDWTTPSAQFPVLEQTGQVTSYGDFNNGGSSGVNVNWVPRQSYGFQVISIWGEKEAEMYGLGKIDYVSEVNLAAVEALNRFMNLTSFFGVGGLANYGALNDPSLPAAITPTTKAAGGVLWTNATAQEIYNDVLKLFIDLQTRTKGAVVMDMAAKMKLVISTTRQPLLKTVSQYNVTAEQTIKQAFPNLTIEWAPEMSTTSGELLQLFVENAGGVDTAYTAFTEKLRNHAVVTDLSGWKQKKSAGTWGTIIRRPIAFAQMLGI